MRANGRCEYCSVDLLSSWSLWSATEIDHILPRKAYPQVEDTIDNTACCCKGCNAIKHGDLPPDWSDASNIPSLRTEKVRAISEWLRIPRVIHGNLGEGLYKRWVSELRESADVRTQFQKLFCIAETLKLLETDGSSLSGAVDIETTVDKLHARFQKMARQFDIDKSELKDWDADDVDKSLGAWSHGEQCVARFLLQVWNPSQQWRSSSFDINEALRVWDQKRRHVFLEWAIAPWWP